MSDVGSGMVGMQIADAAGLQRLYVELLFCDGLRREWVWNKSAVLSRYQLPADMANHLPNVEDEHFQNECHGRRMLIARELHPRFEATLRAAFALGSLQDLGSSAIFTEFLESRHFLTADHSLDHPYGIGRGYENVSKFFLWLRDAKLPFSRQHRQQLHIDFAVHLTRQARHCVSDPLIRTRKGVVFRADPARDDDWILVDANGNVIALKVDNLFEFLSSPFFILDRVDRKGNYLERML